LVRHADPDDPCGLCWSATQAADGLIRRCQGRRPDIGKFVLDPTRLIEVLGKLPIPARDDLCSLIDQQCGHARRPGIQGENYGLLGSHITYPAA